jgi:hypothetical protein
MARMLGRQVWYGVFCSCCNGPRSVKMERAREKRAFARELHPEGLLPSPLDDPTDCGHGCNGECLAGGSESCTFVCHPEGPVTEEQYWAARTALR